MNIKSLYDLYIKSFLYDNICYFIVFGEENQRDKEKNIFKLTLFNFKICPSSNII